MISEMHIGPRGGRYHVSKSGRKVYVKNDNIPSARSRSRNPKPSKSKNDTYGRSRSYSRKRASARYGQRSKVPLISEKYDDVEVVKPKSMKGRGSATKGWKLDDPKHGEERYSLYRRCPNCFLLPEEKKFPICGNDCTLDCRAINSAYVRARQHKYPNVAIKAKSLKNRYGCVSGKGSRSSSRK